MSADSPPSSTDGGGVIENAGDLTSLPTLDPSVPFIDLPDGCDDEDSLRNECHVCGWDGSLEDGILSKNQDPTREDLNNEAPRCSSCKVKLLILEEITRDEAINPEAKDALESVMDCGVVRAMLIGGPGKSRYDIFTAYELPYFHDTGIFNIPRRKTTLNSMEQSMMWARSRIEDCLSLHKLCVMQAEGSVTPTRLIDIDPGGMGLDVRLIDSTTIPPGTSREYAALSYCWGSYKPACMTIPMTKEERRISWESLPQTFRDAVMFTRGLGLKYLWIDCICIIQGDENDWRKEAGKMFDVYRGAKFTLGAVFGDDSTAGLRNIPTPAKQQARHVATLRLGKHEWPLFVRRYHYLSLHRWQNDWKRYASENIRVPLLTRSWIYQERVLSPRVLFFTESEVVYQCACTIECECGSSTQVWKGNLERYFDKRSIAWATQPATTTPRSNEDDTRRTLEIQRTWNHKVVSTYSILKVTNPKDRLVALSGIAQKFQLVRPGSEYLAGLWSDSLIDDLAWIRDSDSQSPSTSERPFNLPTWSWASVPGAFNYEQSLKREHIAEVVEANCVYAKNVPFGILESSKLVLRSRMLPCVLHRGGVLQPGPGHLGDQTWKTDFWRRDDRSGAADSDEPQEVHLFQLMEAEDYFGNWGVSIHCLVLRLEDHVAKRFSRLGMVSYYIENYQGESLDVGLIRAFEERGEVVECEII
ncbi:heterokaryon incompatibility protein-domain-containing protein [Phyllosticta capitalensis]|uniref:Heterokaryon incompatibility protein-domain-containing protein n=1 Tax=Phyllosticta capitalensis TaxID=121624 RepID=A0ABR1YNV1_9PEZI